MADGIHGIGYGNTSGVGGGYVPQRKNEEADINQQKAEAQNTGAERKDVKPDDVYAFMANNSAFVNLVNKTPAKTNGVTTDPTVAERAVAATENYIMLMEILTEEFGEDFAPKAMDIAMDKLLGMV